MALADADGERYIAVLGTAETCRAMQVVATHPVRLDSALYEVVVARTCVGSPSAACSGVVLALDAHDRRTEATADAPCAVVGNTTLVDEPRLTEPHAVHARLKCTTDVGGGDLEEDQAILRVDAKGPFVVVRGLTRSVLWSAIGDDARCSVEALGSMRVRGRRVEVVSPDSQAGKGQRIVYRVLGGAREAVIDNPGRDVRVRFRRTCPK